MPGGGIIIISGGGNRAITSTGVEYPVVAGEGVQNTAAGLPAAHVVFTNGASGAKSDLYLGPGEIIGFMNAGTVCVP